MFMVQKWDKIQKLKVAILKQQQLQFSVEVVIYFLNTTKVKQLVFLLYY